jgi:hypothetical protein
MSEKIGETIHSVTVGVLIGGVLASSVWGFNEAAKLSFETDTPLNYPLLICLLIASIYGVATGLLVWGATQAQKRKDILLNRRYVVPLALLPIFLMIGYPSTIKIHELVFRHFAVGIVYFLMALWLTFVARKKIIPQIQHNN